MLNQNIVRAINSAAEEWGIKCLRYEIRDIHPPENVVAAMHQQVSAERKKRAEILESEGARYRLVIDDKRLHLGNLPLMLPRATNNPRY